jgi:CheY-like chemotaxis protein
VPRAVPEQPLSRSAGTVMLVDDEVFVRATAKRMLEMLGYTPLVAGSGAEALTLQRERGHEITLVILDLAMPEMDGPATFVALKAIDPAVKVLFSSGYFKDARIDKLIAEGALGFVQKPYTIEVLAAQVEKAIGRGRRSNGA